MKRLLKKNTKKSSERKKKRKMSRTKLVSTVQKLLRKNPALAPYLLKDGKVNLSLNKPTNS